MPKDPQNPQPPSPSSLSASKPSSAGSKSCVLTSASSPYWIVLSTQRRVFDSLVYQRCYGQVGGTPPTTVRRSTTFSSLVMSRGKNLTRLQSSSRRPSAADNLACFSPHLGGRQGSPPSEIQISLFHTCPPRWLDQCLREPLCLARGNGPTAVDYSGRADPP